MTLSGIEGARIHISGVVQGVGFRPFVYQIALRSSLMGWVRNTSAGVDIEVDGSHEALKEFVEAIDVNYDWIQPRSNEKNGHPILLGKKIIEKILNAHKNTNLRMLSNNSDILKNYWDCDYSEIFTDIDTDEDFKKLVDQN